MKITLLDRYKRRGNTCHFTFRLEIEPAMLDANGDVYTETFHFAYMRWDGSEWRAQRRWSHAKYPPPRDPTDAELKSALDVSGTPSRAIAAMT